MAAVLAIAILGFCLTVHLVYPGRPQHSPIAPHRPLARDVTYVTHLSYSRIANLQRVLDAWRLPDTAHAGPVVVVFFAGSVQDTQAILSYVRSDLQQPRQLTYTIYSNPSNDLSSYPVNVLRNIGLGHVSTELCVLADGDMVPDRHLYAALSTRKYDEALSAALNKVALVLPIFNLSATAAGAIPPIPDNKPALLAALRSGEAQIKLDHPRRPHHSLTDYPRWQTDTRDYDIRYRFWYDPYLIISPRTAPFFDPRFVYYGFDKVTYMWLLHLLGFRFRVLSDHFLVHVPHKADAGWQADADDSRRAWRQEELLDLVDVYFTELPSAPANWRDELAAT